MITAIKEHVKVLPGGIIQLHAENLKPCLCFLTKPQSSQSPIDLALAERVVKNEFEYKAQKKSV